MLVSGPIAVTADGQVERYLADLAGEKGAI